jgi:hypothetical protein
LRFVQKLFLLLGTIIVSATAFFAAAFFLHVDEVRNLFDLVKRRINRGDSRETTGD